MILLYVGGSFVHESASFELWNHKCTQAIVAFSNVISLITSKYGFRCEGSLMEICKPLPFSGLRNSIIFAIMKNVTRFTFTYSRMTIFF